MATYQVSSFRGLGLGSGLPRDRDGNMYTTVKEWLLAWRRDGCYRTLPARDRRELARELAAKVRDAVRYAKAAQKGGSF